MKRSKKLLSLLLVLMMLMAIFAGCGTKATDIPDDDTPLSAGDVAGEQADSSLGAIRAATAAAYTPTGTMTTLWNSGAPTAAVSGTFYSISSPAEMGYLASYTNGGYNTQGVTFYLTTSVSLSGITWVPIGLATIATNSSTSSPVYSSGNGFAGIFDGTGLGITNLSLTVTQSGSGLFGYVKPSGTIQNLTVGGSVSAASAVDTVNGAIGGVVGYNDGTISNVTSSVVVNAPTSYNVGGIAGFNDGYTGYTTGAVGSISACTNSGAVTGTAKIGGITGENAGTITNCTNTGAITSGASGKNGIGGIAGRNGNNNTAVETGTITSCTNSGAISDANGQWVGGIAGFQNAPSTTTNCTNSGTITAYGGSGPIIGSDEGTTTNSYNSVTISAGGSYTVTGNTQYTIVTTAAVTLAGNGTPYYVTVLATGGNTNLTINSLLVTGPVNSTSCVIDFGTSTGNTLTYQGTCEINSSTAINNAAIHVGVGGIATITNAAPTSTLYLYDSGLAAGIGGNYQEVNGTITIYAGNFFLKNSQTGAGIGTGANATGTPGAITLSGGQFNLVTVSNGAAIGGGNGGTISTINISDTSMNIICAWNGAAIGVGNSATVTGTVYINPATTSLFTAATTDRTSTTPLVTASVYQTDTTAPQLYEMSASGVASGSFSATVGSTSGYLTGTTNVYAYTPSSTSTQANWTAGSTGTVGAWGPGGSSQTMVISGNTYYQIWNSTTNLFTVKINLGGGGSDAQSTLTAAEDVLGLSAGVINVVGTVAIGTSETIALASNQQITRDPSLTTGALFTINPSMSLTMTSGVITDSAANTDISVNTGGTFTVSPSSSLPFAINGIIYLANGLYINVGATVANITGTLNVQMATPATGQVMAQVVGSYSAFSVQDVNKFNSVDDVELETNSSGTQIVVG